MAVDVVTDVALGTFHRENTRSRPEKRAAYSNLATTLNSRMTRGKDHTRESPQPGYAVNVAALRASREIRTGKPRERPIRRENEVDLPRERHVRGRAATSIDDPESERIFHAIVKISTLLPSHENEFRFCLSR